MDEREIRALSRRHIVGAVGAGVAAAAAGPALAQQNAPRAASASGAMDPSLQDPRDKYPKPPFRAQTQPWPDLARDMDPKPDHGETSYRGSNRLARRKALITGGDPAGAAPRRSPMGARAPMSRSTISQPKSPTRAR